MNIYEAYASVLFYLEWTFITTCEYVDLAYVSWVVWLVYPLLLTFILPVFIILGVYASSLLAHFYRLRHHLREPLKDALQNCQFTQGVRHMVAALWDAHGRVWHGYEVIGLERIPTTGPALLIYYHGALPIDLYYLMAKVILHQQRQIWAIGDRFLFKIPGMRLLLDIFHVLPGTVTGGVEIMKEGNLLSIAPGGVREAYFSHDYSLLWGKRVGFAKIAVESQVPIIPVFTQNCREAFRTLSIGRSWWRKLYEFTRLPLVPLYGGFPVKLRTFIGEPIICDSSMSPDQLANKVRCALEDLIKRHQVIPGTIFRALCERFYTPEHVKDS